MKIARALTKDTRATLHVRMYNTFDYGRYATLTQGVEACIGIEMHAGKIPMKDRVL